MIHVNCLEGSLAHCARLISIHHYDPASPFSSFWAPQGLSLVPGEISGKYEETDLKKIYPLCWKTTQSTRSTKSGSVVCSLEIKDSTLFELKCSKGINSFLAQNTFSLAASFSFKPPNDSVCHYKPFSSASTKHKGIPSFNPQNSLSL